MIGNSLNEFINDLYFNPEKEIVYRKKKYLISGYVSNGDYTIEVVDIENHNIIFLVSSKDRADCVKRFGETKIFDGNTVYEAEQEIQVLYG